MSREVIRLSKTLQNLAEDILSRSKYYAQLFICNYTKMEYSDIKAGTDLQ
jgi:hypothetical protein